MMINKRLIGTVAESKKYIAGNVVLQWCSLAANISMMFSITNLFAGLYYGSTSGQCQRLALARALLHDSPVYIFDEATSNIDVESENDIMAEIHTLAKHKTVLLISHRLANVIQSDNIYVLENGRIAESGSHTELLQNHGLYERLWNAQQSLENYGKEGDAR